MLRHVKRFGKIALMALVFSGVEAFPAFGFTDISQYWGQPCISYLSYRNLVSGYPDGRFQPNATVTRAEFAVLMLNAFPTVPRSRQVSNFTDVPNQHWAYRAIRDAAERAFFTGYPDGTFRPNQAIPKVQAIAIVANALNQPIPDRPDATLTLFFDDTQQIPAYARRAIAAGAIRNLAIVGAAPRQLKPNQNMTRGEVAALLCQAIERDDLVPDQYVAGGRHLFVDRRSVPREALIEPQPGRPSFVWVDGKVGFVDENGTVILQTQFENASSPTEGLAAVMTSEYQWGFINQLGEVVIQPQFDAVLPFSEGLAGVLIDGKWGFIDREGAIAITPRFYGPSVDDPYGEPSSFSGKVIEPFSDGLALVRLGERVGFIDRTGAFVIEPIFSDARSFRGGYALVNVGGSWFSEALGFTQGGGPQGPYATSLREGEWGYIRHPNR